MPRPPSPPVTEAKPAAQILRVGQGVREPKRIAGAPPEYPAFARNSHVQGVVILEAVINERGTIERVKVLKSVPLLDAAADRRRERLALYSDAAERRADLRSDDDHHELHASGLMRAFVLALLATALGPLAQDAAIDPSLRAAVERFYATQQAEDVAGVLVAVVEHGAASAAGAAQVHL